MTLVSTDWLNENINKVKIIDASWHLAKNRNAIEEYNEEHIENAIFFGLEKNSNQRKNLPHNHFLPSINDHERSISKMGISNTDRIVIYCYNDYDGGLAILNTPLHSAGNQWFAERRAIAKLYDRQYERVMFNSRMKSMRRNNGVRWNVYVNSNGNWNIGIGGW